MATKARVKRSAVNRHQKAAVRVALIDGVCTKAAACAVVTNSPVASAALAALKTSNGNAKTSLALHASLLLQAKAAGKAAISDIADVEAKATTYMNAVDDIALGDATIITDAGLTVRDETPQASTAAKVTVVKFEPGKESKEAIVSWPPSVGAGAYALRVNFTPTDPTKWQDMPTTTSRRRTIVAPTPAAQFLVMVAAIGNEGPSDWSDAVMVTAR
jgi:hypothetical protein